MKTIFVDAVYAFVVKAKDGFEIYEPLRQLLDEFPNPKIILTGANDEQFKVYGLSHMPYEVFTLKHDPEKTDPAYYTTLLARFNLRPEDVVYFEHSVEAVKSARSVGITTYHWDDTTRPLTELHAFLKEVLTE